MSSLTSIESASASRLPKAGIHVAIISDGNGRWATSKGLPRSAGHRAGAETARSIIAAAPGAGIHTLTLFALSSANWQRPAAEVAAILRLLHEYLLTETSRCMEEGVRLNVIGRRDRLPVNLRQTIAMPKAATAGGRRLHLRLAIDYSAREAIFLAACRFYKVTELSCEAFGKYCGVQPRWFDGCGPVDSNGRGATAFGFSIVGMRVCGICIRVEAVAGFYGWRICARRWRNLGGENGQGEFAGGDSGLSQFRNTQPINRGSNYSFEAALRARCMAKALCRMRSAVSVKMEAVQVVFAREFEGGDVAGCGVISADALAEIVGDHEVVARLGDFAGDAAGGMRSRDDSFEDFDKVEDANMQAGFLQ